jgi:hypothetical protein
MVSAMADPKLGQAEGASTSLAAPPSIAALPQAPAEARARDSAVELIEALYRIGMSELLSAVRRRTRAARTPVQTR